MKKNKLVQKNELVQKIKREQTIKREPKIERVQHLKLLQQFKQASRIMLLTASPCLVALSAQAGSAETGSTETASAKSASSNLNSAATTSTAANYQPQFHGAVSAKALSNSNLKTSELDNASGKSASGAEVTAQLGVNWQLNSQFQASVDYQLSQQTWQDNPEFKTRLQLWSADVNYELATGYVLGIAAHNAAADLASEPLLKLSKLSLYSSKLWQDQYYLRASMDFSQKNFASFNERDADNRSLRSDFFWFIQADRFMQLALGYQHESSVGGQFDFSGPQLQFKLSQQWRLWDMPQKVQLGWQYQRKAYDQFQWQQPNADKTGKTAPNSLLSDSSSAVSTGRTDQIHNLQLSYTVQPHKNLEFTADLSRSRASSAYQPAAYRQNQAAVGVKLSF